MHSLLSLFTVLHNYLCSRGGGINAGILYNGPMKFLHLQIFLCYLATCHGYRSDVFTYCRSLQNREKTIVPLPYSVVIPMFNRQQILGKAHHESSLDDQDALYRFCKERGHSEILANTSQLLSQSWADDDDDERLL